MMQQSHNEFSHITLGQYGYESTNDNFKNFIHESTWIIREFRSDCMLLYAFVIDDKSAFV